MSSKILYIANSKNKSEKGIYLFALPWLVIGIQHFIYAPFVQSLVPSFIPFKLLWVYATGLAMILAGIGLLLRLKIKLAALLLGIMLSIFILLVHLPVLINNSSLIEWVRTAQDTALMGTAFMLTGNKKIATVGIISFSFATVVQGFQHFQNPVFITANTPLYFPYIKLCNMIVGILLIILGLNILMRRYKNLAANFLGLLILSLSLLYYFPLLYINISYGQLWTGLMLNIGLSGGAFIAAGNLIKSGNEISTG